MTACHEVVSANLFMIIFELILKLEFALSDVEKSDSSSRGFRTGLKQPSAPKL